MAPDELDEVFERLAVQGWDALHDGDLHQAATTLECALVLWRGDLLHGLDLWGPLASWAERLHEERRTATENLLEARLALGRHHEIVGSLAAWASKHPLREHTPSSCWRSTAPGSNAKLSIPTSGCGPRSSTRSARNRRLPFGNCSTGFLRLTQSWS